MENKTVQYYNQRERNKYNLGMAKNNAAVVLSKQSHVMSNMKEIIKYLYQMYKELDEELKEDLQ